MALAVPSATLVTSVTRVTAGQPPWLPTLPTPCQSDEQGAVRDEAGRHEQCVDRNDASVAQLHAPQLVHVVDDQLVDGALDDADTAGEQLGSLNGGEDVGRSEVGEVVGPLPNDVRVADSARGAADDAERVVADLVTVTIGAVQNISGPPVAQPGDVRQLIAETGGDQHTPSGDSLSAGKECQESVAIGNKVGDRAVDDLPAVTVHFVASGGQQFGGRHAVTGEVTVQVSGRGVTRAPGVHHHDRTAGPRQHQGRGQAGGTPSDDDDVVMIHAPKAG